MSTETSSIDVKSGRAKRGLSTFFLLAALAFQIWLLVTDFPILNFLLDPGARPAASAPPIAELVTAKNDVRVQSPGDLVWEKARDGQTLLRRQSILTSALSKAEIAFLDGTGIVVDENSLIQVEKTPGDDSLGYEKITIRLLRGELHKSQPRGKSEILRRLAPGTPQLQIEAGPVVATLAPSSELSVRASGEMQVSSGEVDVQARSGGPMAKVRAGDQLAVGSDGSLKTRESPFSLLSPKPDETLAAPGAVTFRWNVNLPGLSTSPQLLELSRDAGFAESATVRSTIPAASRPLKYIETSASIGGDGVWYWRVRSLGPSAAASGTQKVFVAGARAPEPQLPVENAAAWAERPVSFSWEPAEGASRYELEIAGESRPSAANYARVERLPAGSIQWRVRAQLKDGKMSPWSAKRTLRVIAAASAPAGGDKPTAGLPPPPDEIFEPEIQPAPAVPQPTHSWIEWLLPSANADSEKPSQFKVHLKWKAVPGATKYRVQISKTRAFKETLVEVQTDKPDFVWNYRPGMENSKGRVFYRVASVDGRERVGRYSKPKIISLRQALQIYAAIAGKTEPAPKPEIKPSEPAPKAEEHDLVGSPANTVSAVTAPAPAAPEAFRLHGAGSFGFGYGSLSQNGSGGDLNTVRVQSPFVQQHLLLELQTMARHASGWQARVYANTASFEGERTNGYRYTLQPKTGAFNLKLVLTHAAGSSDGNFQFGWGTVIDRSYRWVKADLQAIDTQGAISIGPSFWVLEDFGVWEIGSGLDVPTSGLLTHGQLSVQSSTWAAWRVGGSWLGLRLEFDTSYTAWNHPYSVQTTNWVVWAAPTIHFGGVN